MKVVKTSQWVCVAYMKMGSEVKDLKIEIASHVWVNKLFWIVRRVPLASWRKFYGFFFNFSLTARSRHTSEHFREFSEFATSTMAARFLFIRRWGIAVFSLKNVSVPMLWLLSPDLLTPLNIVQITLRAGMTHEISGKIWCVFSSISKWKLAQLPCKHRVKMRKTLRC